MKYNPKLLYNMKYNSCINLFFLGICIGIIFILLFFGTSIVEKSEPKIIINIGNIIRNSSIYLFNIHIHHWIIGTVLLLGIILMEQYYSAKSFSVLKGIAIVLIIHGLMYKDRFDFS